MNKSKPPAMKSAYFLFINLVLLCACEKNNTDPVQQEPANLELTKTTTDIIDADNQFGFDIFQKVIKNDTASDNVFISPTSISLALAMTYNGAGSETKSAMELALRKQGFTTEEINSGYQSLIKALKSVDPKVLLEIANSIWYRQNFTVLPDFISINSQFYNAEVNSLDFSDPGSVDVINGWVNDNTHGKIKEIIDNIPGNAVMYLINAIYFKGLWRYEFDESKTTPGTFNAADGNSVQVNYMFQSATLSYNNNGQFGMIEIPYGRGNFSMMILLPNEGFTLEEVIDSLTNVSWNTWISGMTSRNIDLVLPKFKFEYKHLLNRELSEMGMGVAFSDGADFSGINGTGGLQISRVIHKSFVEVNETGTEAAAVTAVEIIETSYPPQNIEFYVNHPFIFAIRETTTGAILFMGKVNNPATINNGE